MFADERIDAVVEWAVGIANSGKYGYSQDSYLRWGHGYYDCSSFVITALEKGNFPMIMNGATFTGNMAHALIECGFVMCTDNNLKRGDILLTHREKGVQHTAIYIGKNTIVHARNSKYGICCSPYYKFDSRYRYYELFEKDDFKMKQLSKGMKCYEVKILQILLNFYCYTDLSIDGIFGDLTHGAVCNFQKSHNQDAQNPLVVDGIVGIATWTKLLKGI
ncbi:MAG: C40 family peptidase [Methanobrevibacter sp.]|nr:C40 family peptidase [Methanobrevibacter sp.]